MLMLHVLPHTAWEALWRWASKVEKHIHRMVALMMLSEALGIFKHMLPASLSVFTLPLNCGRAVNRTNILSLFLIRRLLLIAEIMTLPTMSSSHLEGKSGECLGFWTWPRFPESLGLRVPAYLMPFIGMWPNDDFVHYLIMPLDIASTGLPLLSDSQAFL